MKITVAGDFAPRLRLQQQIEDHNFEEIFDKKLLKIIKSSDFSIANLESPVADETCKPIYKYGPNLKCTTAAIEALNYANFGIVTMANNHILDYGEAGLNKTLKYCKKMGIKTVGAGINLSQSKKTLYLSKNSQRLAIINCCEHEFSIATENTGGAHPLNPISQYYTIQDAKKNADSVLVIIHGGHEHYQLPSLRMQETYRFFIDAGADAVVNHHQHCYSGYEFYKNKPIFYGLGNFAFDSNIRNSSWNAGFMVQFDFKENATDFSIIPYIQYNDSPNVTICDPEQQILFENSIKKLNGIIADKTLLQEENHKYYKTCIPWEISILEPYRGKLLYKLYNMRLLPSFIKRRKIPALLNHIHCESHRDKLIFALKDKNNKYKL